MQPVLYVGILSQLPCGIRPIVTVAAVVGVGIFVSSMFWFVALVKCGGLPQAPAQKLLLKWLSVAVIGVSMLFSLVPMLSASLTLIYLEADEVVATGCKRGLAYEVHEPLLQMDSELRHGRGGAMAHVYSRDGKIRFSTKLEGNKYLSNLVKAAPTAMRQYADELRSNGLPRPNALLHSSLQ